MTWTGHPDSICVLGYATFGSTSSWMTFDAWPRQLLHGLKGFDTRLLDLMQRLNRNGRSRLSVASAPQLESEASVAAPDDPAERVQNVFGGDSPALMLHFVLSAAALRRIAISATIDRQQLWLASGSHYYGKREEQAKKKMPWPGTAIRWLATGASAVAVCSALFCRRKRRGRRRRVNKAVTSTGFELARVPNTCFMSPTSKQPGILAGGFDLMKKTCGMSMGVPASGSGAPAAVAG